MFDPERVLRLLNEEQVAYLVIGGLASNLHGYDSRTWRPTRVIRARGRKLRPVSNSASVDHACPPSSGGWP